VPTLQTAIPIPFTVSWAWDLCLKNYKITEKYFLRVYSEFIGDRRGTEHRFVFTKQNKNTIFVYRKQSNESRIQYLHNFTQAIEVD
jgi:hypothetical protein